MFGLGIACGAACLVLVAPVPRDGPKEADRKAVPVTKEKILGRWEGPKDGPLALEFTDRKVKVTVTANEGGVPKTTTLEWDYVVQTKDNWVNLHPLDQGGGLGGAKLYSDGTLSVVMVAVPPAIPQPLKDIRLTRAMPKGADK